MNDITSRVDEFAILNLIAIIIGFIYFINKLVVLLNYMHYTTSFK